MSAAAPRPASDAAPIRLGLIGDNIAASSSPRLHALVGEQLDLPISYERLVPREEELGFGALLARCRAEGYRGVNVTYPYKERVVWMVTVDDPNVRALGSVNTVLFESDGPRGHNTDHTGFIEAYRGARHEPPGTVAMIGTGGVGRAVAFGLRTLGAREIRLHDLDEGKARRLADELAQAGGNVVFHASPDAAAAGADGLVNCTPIGMVGREGTPLPREAMVGAAWAFDAVYTPMDTRFLRDAAASDLEIITGWELFFWQGVHAARLFTGCDPDVAQLRAALLEDDE